ncbi:50S ribosomal protein L11 methyltransferase [Pedobacter alpinus]|uniref:Ribosomal protein L11 methyltransferase n=1 Tax=Pedobacter alpinus TaxID=1590643 RepID=A0ABW5TV97_9SPHI
MNYKELVFTVLSDESYQKDILIAALGEIDYDTFEETEEGFKAYITEDAYSEIKLQNTIGIYNCSINFSFIINDVEQENWNQVWESNFEPIEIKDQVYVRATFHQPKPAFKHEIIIDPKMAFGTGHHQTTAMIMEYLLETDVADKTILDMGCGTAILAILASKLGAQSLVAIDNDSVCYESTLENAELNQINNLNAFCGSKEVIPQQQFEIILANINRNILLDQIETYAEVLSAKGEIFFSGFYESPDLKMIEEEANKYGLNYVSHKKTDLWVAARFIKN